MSQFNALFYHSPGFTPEFSFYSPQKSRVAICHIGLVPLGITFLCGSSGFSAPADRLNVFFDNEHVSFYFIIEVISIQRNDAAISSACEVSLSISRSMTDMLGTLWDHNYRRRRAETMKIGT
jgi:hypothetical protein